MRLTTIFVAAASFLALAGAVDIGPIQGRVAFRGETAVSNTDDIPEVSPVTGTRGYPAGGACIGCGDRVKKCLAVCHTGPSNDCDSFCSCSLTSDPKGRCRYLRCIKKPRDCAKWNLDEAAVESRSIDAPEDSKDNAVPAVQSGSCDYCNAELDRCQRTCGSDKQCQRDCACTNGVCSKCRGPLADCDSLSASAAADDITARDEAAPQKHACEVCVSDMWWCSCHCNDIGVLTLECLDTCTCSPMTCTSCTQSFHTKCPGKVEARDSPPSPPIQKDVCDDCLSDKGWCQQFCRGDKACETQCLCYYGNCQDCPKWQNSCPKVDARDQASPQLDACDEDRCLYDMRSCEHRCDGDLSCENQCYCTLGNCQHCPWSHVSYPKAEAHEEALSKVEARDEVSLQTAACNDDLCLSNLAPCYNDCANDMWWCQQYCPGDATCQFDCLCHWGNCPKCPGWTYQCPKVEAGGFSPFPPIEARDSSPSPPIDPCTVCRTGIYKCQQNCRGDLACGATCKCEIDACKKCPKIPISCPKIEARDDMEPCILCKEGMKACHAGCGGKFNCEQQCPCRLDACRLASNTKCPWDTPHCSRSLGETSSKGEARVSKMSRRADDPSWSTPSCQTCTSVIKECLTHCGNTPDCSFRCTCSAKLKNDSCKKCEAIKMLKDCLKPK